MRLCTKRKAYYSIPGELKQKRCTPKELRTSLHTNATVKGQLAYKAGKPFHSDSSNLYKNYDHDTRRACTPTPAAASVLSIGTRRGPPALVLPRAAANNRLAAPPIRPASAAGS
jgi:hypothetical protein